MSREVCGICWTPYEDDGKCGCPPCATQDCMPSKCRNCVSLEEQNTELDKKLAELSERHLTDEVIADLWHQNGGFHHHFARAVERWLKGKDHA
jgi:hypothetical protein